MPKSICHQVLQIESRMIMSHNDVNHECLFVIIEQHCKYMDFPAASKFVAKLVEDKEKVVKACVYLILWNGLQF
jgi:hypothetical protein